IASSEQVGNVSTWHLLQFCIPLGTIRHVAALDVARVLGEPEVKHSFRYSFSVPAVFSLGENPVQGEPVALGRTLERRRLSEAFAPPADVRLALDGITEAAPSIRIDLSDSASRRFVPQRHQSLGRQTIWVKLFGDELEEGWFLGRSRLIARDGRQNVFILILILFLFLFLFLNRIGYRTGLRLGIG